MRPSTGLGVFRLAVLTLGLLAWMPAAVAQTNLSFGVAAMQGQSPYKGVNNNRNTIPAFVSYRSRFAYIQGLEAGVHAWGRGGPWGGLQASVLVSGRLAGYSSRDSWFLAGMDSRGWSLDGGLGFSGRVNSHQFSIQGVHDLLNKHQGYELSGRYSYGVQVTEQVRLSPGVALSWQSADLLDYYFGVTEAEARPALGRDFYRVGSGWEPSLNLNLTYAITPKDSLMLAGRTRWLPASVIDSPLVDRKNVTSFFIAYVRRF